MKNKNTTKNSKSEDKIKQEIINFIKENKVKYSTMISTYGADSLYNAFHCRKLFFDWENSIRKIAERSKEFDEEQLSDSKKKEFRKILMCHDKNSPALAELVRNIRNRNILATPGNNTTLVDRKNFHAVSRLTFMDALNESKNAHKNIKAHMNFLEKCHHHISIDTSSIPESCKINPELNDSINKINNKFHSFLPEIYPYSDNTSVRSNIWLTVDLTFSDDVILTHFKKVIAREREKHPDLLKESKTNTLLIEDIKRNVRKMDVFIVIDALILCVEQGITLTNAEINNALNSPDNESRRIKHAIDYFMDMLENNCIANILTTSDV